MTFINFFILAMFLALFEINLTVKTFSIDHNYALLYLNVLNRTKTYMILFIGNSTEAEHVLRI